MVNGTKCLETPMGFDFHPQILSDIYKEIVAEHGSHALRKPKPGDTYRKMYKPIYAIDGPVFRRLPADIIITEPPRLFRSTGYKYHGRVYLDAELYWEFEYKYQFGDKWLYNWEAVRLLSWCYIPTLTFQKRSGPQLSLF